MPTSYTSVLKLALPATGELSGTWGDVVNQNITQMVEQAITGLATINTWTGASHTLTVANGTTSESRCAILECSGTPGADATVICPTATKLYILKNSVTGGYAVTLKTASGTGISVPNGRTALLYCDGTNVVVGVDYAASLALGTPLTVANGGTGLTTTPVNGAIDIGNGTGFTRTTLTAGANVTITNGAGSITISATSSGGSVTSVNTSGGTTGFSFTGGPITSSGTLTMTGTLNVANGGTGATTLTGLIKGNGTSAMTAAVAGTDYQAAISATGILKGAGSGSVSAATAGTDYVAPATATDFTATQTFTGAANTLAAILKNTAEVVTVSATAATGTINYDTTTQSVLYYTTPSTANWTINFRASSGATLDSLMSTGQSVTVVFMATNGGTAYYNNAVQINNSTTGVTTKWQGGTAPTSGNASSIDVYTYVIIKTGSATFTVLASQTKFA